MKKLFLISLLFFSAESFASNGECHHQRNPIGFEDYDVCEVEGTGYSCVSFKGKSNNGISCFPTPASQDQDLKKDSTAKKLKYIERDSNVSY
jgi:hypothetical protein